VIIEGLRGRGGQESDQRGKRNEKMIGRNEGREMREEERLG
jgi:hypothetical protein